MYIRVYIIIVYVFDKTNIYNSNQRKIIKIVDILGRGMPHPMPNNPYFIIYDDGIIEKRIIIE